MAFPNFSRAAHTLACISIAISAYAFNLDDTIYEDAALQVGVDPLLLYSVSVHTSSRYIGKGQVSPSPYALRSDVLTSHFDNKDDAVKALRGILIETQSVEIGLMQISHYYHPQNNPEDLLDPLTNLVIGAEILKEELLKGGNPILAVGKYFSPNKIKARQSGSIVWNIYAELAAMKHQGEESSE